MNADAGEMGYGGVMDGKTVSGDLPVDIIGCSSTRRELVALRLAAADMVERLKGRQVTIKMDSIPAVRNLIKGGGNKPDLSWEVKQWYLFCEEHKMECEYEWVPREQNEAADTASKQAAMSLTIARPHT